MTGYLSLGAGLVENTGGAAQPKESTSVAHEVSSDAV